MAVLRISSSDIDESGQYDAVVATLGFESRCTQVAGILRGRASKIWAFDYQSEPVHSYLDNSKFFQQFEVIKEPEALIRKSLWSMIQGVREHLTLNPANGTEPPIPRIAVDISSMDRDRLARVVLACTEDQTEPIQVDFFYSFGAFDPNLVGSEGAVLVNRPVDGLEGWPSTPDAPLICVVGLGFESRLATAAIETLEPFSTVIMFPRGEDDRFEAVVQDRNAELLDGNTAADSIHDYQVGNLTQTISDLDASISAWTRDNRVVLVPLGPKPFALCAILVGVAHSSNVTVWRMSADEGREPEDRLATGTVVGLSVLVRPLQDST